MFVRAKKPSYKRRIGLLGGSFNPAHSGHIHISLQAYKKHGLAEIWWLVSPANPLKDKNILVGYDERLEAAINITAAHKMIKISDFEAQNCRSPYYTINTIRQLKIRHKEIEFYWIMGADNLQNFHKWRNWRNIIAEIKIIICDRSPFSYSVLHSKAAIYAKTTNQNFSYIFSKRNSESSTFIRDKQ